MTAVAATPTMAPVMHPYPGRGRWTVAAILVAGPALQAVEFLVGTNPRADAAARVAFWSENQGTVGVAITAGFLAVPFLLGGFAAMVAFSVRDSQRLAWAAAALLTFAMAGLAAVQGSLVAVYGLVLAGEEAAAVRVLEGASIGMPGIAMFAAFLIGASLGVPTLAVALWRSRFVPRVVPVLLVAFFVLDFALFQPVFSHLVSLAAFVVVAWAIVTGFQRPQRGGTPRSPQSPGEASR